jgi:crossover junction endodeoxyribonuclease RuvC
MLVVGIDPGLGGAIARLDGAAVAVWDLPLTRVKRGGKMREVIDAVALARLIGLEVLGDYCDPGDATVFVEWASSSPNMGVSSAFRYGEGFGLIRGVLAHLGVPTRLVPAAKWKREMGLVTKGSRELGRNEARDKAPALDLARKLYPQILGDLERKKDEGRAEALLIAHYGCELLEAEALARSA